MVAICSICIVWALLLGSSGDVGTLGGNCGVEKLEPQRFLKGVIGIAIIKLTVNSITLNTIPNSTYIDEIPSSAQDVKYLIASESDWELEKKVEWLSQQQVELVE
jgi:hypothetical protein